MKVGIVQFPGSNCDFDVLHVLRNVMHAEAQLVWHTEFDGDRFDSAVLPGGFSYGDHLRAGVIAAYSPAISHVRQMAHDGKPVLGICNGFQILAETGLLPGALLQNRSLTFVCRWVGLRVETNRTPFTRLIPASTVIHLPIAHAEGRYILQEQDLENLIRQQRVVFVFSEEDGTVTDSANPNGASGNVAGICNPEGNVMGLMPHPERASEAILSPYGCNDGLLIFKSMLAGA